jgi:transcriptional regulator with XRE-family HTH domain
MLTLSTSFSNTNIRSLGYAREMILTGLQCRLARAALQITVAQLAERTLVSAPAINRLENDKNKTKPNAATLKVLRAFFEQEGVEFLNGEGVRLKR